MLALSAAGAPTALWGQPVPEPIARERSEFATWLTTAALSPYRAMVQHPIGPAIRLGPPSAEVPLSGVDARIEQRSAALSLTVNGSTRPLPKDRATSLGGYQLVPSGLPGQAVVTVFGPPAKVAPAPGYFPYAPGWRFEVTLAPVKTGRTERMLAPDGVEVEATEAGTVQVPVGGRLVTLRVFRIPAPGGEESDLEIFYRDGTNGSATYPAGRFVSLIPTAGDRFVLDFNRARNPFCAYNTVFACPAPWRGNVIPVPVPAGEQYAAAPSKKS